MSWDTINLLYCDIVRRRESYMTVTHQNRIGLFTASLLCPLLSTTHLTSTQPLAIQVLHLQWNILSDSDDSGPQSCHGLSPCCVRA